MFVLQKLIVKAYYLHCILYQIIFYFFTITNFVYKKYNKF